MPIPISRTNNANDGAGSLMGVERENIFRFVLGVFLGMTIALKGHESGIPIYPALALGALPIGVISFWIFALRQGKPPGYDIDYLENILQGPSWAPPLEQPRHPFLNAEEKETK